MSTITRFVQELAEAKLSIQVAAEVNGHGNRVLRLFLGEDCDRYAMDFDDDFRAEGWRQYDTDQDAWYFGVWVNPRQFRILTYAEGDVTLVVCPDAEHYNAELAAMNRFYGEGRIATVIDGQTGDTTVYRQNREQFFTQ